MKMKSSNQKLIFFAALVIVILLYWCNYVYNAEQTTWSTSTRTDFMKNVAPLILDNTKTEEYMVNMSRLIQARVPADDRTLIDLLRTHFIEPPATLPYNLTHPDEIHQSPGQTQYIDNVLNSMNKGFFIECGAHDGEFLSNSLFLERYRNWSGVLIEPNKESYQSIRAKQRKAYTLNTCLSIKTHPTLETLYTEKYPALGEINRKPRNPKKTGTYWPVQCFPIYSVLLALNQLSVDYFSLDVEGDEKGVLDSIPWDKVDIKIFSIEHNRWPGGKKNLMKYMERRGYITMTEIKDGYAPDIIFMKK